MIYLYVDIVRSIPIKYGQSTNDQSTKKGAWFGASGEEHVEMRSCTRLSARTPAHHRVTSSSEPETRRAAASGASSTGSARLQPPCSAAAAGRVGLTGSRGRVTLSLAPRLARLEQLAPILVDGEPKRRRPPLRAWRPATLASATRRHHEPPPRRAARRAAASLPPSSSFTA